MKVFNRFSTLLFKNFINNINDCKNSKYWDGNCWNAMQRWWHDDNINQLDEIYSWNNNWNLEHAAIWIKLADITINGDQLISLTPSVLWCCCLGNRKSIQPVKTSTSNSLGWQSQSTLSATRPAYFKEGYVEFLACHVIVRMLRIRMTGDCNPLFQIYLENGHQSGVFGVNSLY